MMSNLARRDNGGTIDYNGDGIPDATMYHIVKTQKAVLIDPNEDGAVGKIVGTAIASLIKRPIHTMKEIWGWLALGIFFFYIAIAWGSSKPVIPETKNFADNLRPDVVGAGLGRTGKAITTNVVDSATASDMVPTTSLSKKTTVKVD